MATTPAPAPRWESLAAALAVLTSIRTSDPITAAAVLSPAFSDRGLRDAVLVSTARSGKWDDLALAATHTALEAARGGDTQGAADALAVLAAATWITGRATEALLITDAALAANPGHKLARLIGLAVSQDSSPQAWAAAMADTDLDRCLAFTG